MSLEHIKFEEGVETVLSSTGIEGELWPWCRSRWKENMSNWSELAEIRLHHYAIQQLELTRLWVQLESDCHESSLTKFMNEWLLTPFRGCQRRRPYPHTWSCPWSWGEISDARFEPKRCCVFCPQREWRSRRLRETWLRLLACRLLRSTLHLVSQLACWFDRVLQRSLGPI